MICSIEGCNKLIHVKSRGLCNAHYQRWRVHGNPTSGAPLRGGVQLYFRDVVLPYEGDDCLIWPFARNANGYGTIRGGIVSRFVCEHAHGPAPTEKHEAAHSCGKGHEACVTKLHMSWKTHAENMADKLVHGTHTRGDRCWSAKLTWGEVSEIRNLRGVLTQKDLAEKYGVAKSRIHKIMSGKTWIEAGEPL